MNFIGTYWSLVPALVAICLALITKEVYSSLFAGILIGALFYSGFSFEGTFTHIINDGLIAVLSDPYNVGILIFLVILGALVALMNKGGGSQAFGKWASKNIKTRTGASLATWLLGVIIFVDDYFNCLTVGSVMKPVTDKFNISRAKLAYLIDATAAPICIIAPISSWAAAVSGFVEGEENGLKLFISAIPYNYYAIFTMFAIVLISIMNINFGPMREYEAKAMRGDVYGIKDTTHKVEKVEGKGEVIDLILPVVILVVSCVLGLIYSGGFFKGENNLIDSFANSDASVGLVIGSCFTLIIVIVYYIIKGVLPFRSCMDCIIEGFTNMVPAIVILTFAWCLKTMTDSLGASTFVESIVSKSMQDLYILLPCIIFIIGAFISFATGTSWGTFGILIPIVVSLFVGKDRELMTIGISACMAGAVFGDHCSPISDTTIMSSAGAECNHILHVSTQLPYAVLVAIVSFISYYIAASTRNVVIPLVAGIVILYLALICIKYFYGSRRTPDKVKSKKRK